MIEKDIHGSQYIELLPFIQEEGGDQVDHWLQRWHDAKGKEGKPALSSKVFQANKNLEEGIWRKPLLLWMIADLEERGHVTKQELSTALDSTHLFLRLLDNLTWRVQHHTTATYAEDRARTVKFRHLARRLAAWRNFNEADGGIDLDAFTQSLKGHDADLWREVGAKDAVVCSFFGGADGKKIDFSHKAFREFLLAEYLLEQFVLAAVEERLREDRTPLLIGRPSAEVMRFFSDLCTDFFQALKQRPGSPPHGLEQFLAACAEASTSVKLVLDTQKEALATKVMEAARKWFEQETLYFATSSGKDVDAHGKSIHQVIGPLRANAGLGWDRLYPLMVLTAWQRSQEKKTFMESALGVARDCPLLHQFFEWQSGLPDKGWNCRNLILNFSTLDLAGANLQRANLYEADLYQANLGGANLGGANLGGANLQRAILEAANIPLADLQGANLQRAILEAANLKAANLKAANLKGANLGGANLQRAILEAANLRGANLKFANLEGANLQEANLEGAILQFANLEGAILQFANLEGANLRKARLENVRGLSEKELEALKQRVKP